MPGWTPKPPHDCRITIRCLTQTFGFKMPIEQQFLELRSQNSLIDRLFELRESDEAGGEGGERVRQIRMRPAFKLTMGRMRGATWFDNTRHPQGVIWLLGAELHDERHKGRADAYDILGQLEDSGELFPGELDYKLLELHRRLWDVSSFADDLHADADALIQDLSQRERTSRTLANVPVRAVIARDDSVVGFYVAVSTRPVIGQRSGLEFPLTDERFTLLQEGVRAGVERSLGGVCLAGDWQDMSVFPGGGREERAFVILTGPTSS